MTAACGAAAALDGGVYRGGAAEMRRHSKSWRLRMPVCFSSVEKKLWK